MLIDTNGFDGNLYMAYEVDGKFIPAYMQISKEYIPSIIDDVIVFSYANYQDEYNMKLPNALCYSSKEECQIACNKLNGEK